MVVLLCKSGRPALKHTRPQAVVMTLAVSGKPLATVEWGRFLRDSMAGFLVMAFPYQPWAHVVVP